MTTLVELLRCDIPQSITHQAADRIEQLERQLEICQINRTGFAELYVERGEQIALLRDAATNLVNFILHPYWDADETIPELVAMQTVLAAIEEKK